MDANEINIFENFLSSYNTELLAKVSRLEELIGRDHWLSVGNYKESILRRLISNILPRRYEVSTGFILACSREGKSIKSKQIDIIIWDSVNYAPVFRDGDFVIVPPESCSAVIEVKGKLTSKELHNSLLNIDSLIYFCETAFPFWNHICKYIFAYDIAEDFKFPNSLWQVIANNYNRGNFISLKNRMECSNSKARFYREGRTHDSFWNPLFSVDAIFVLPLGVIKRDVMYFNSVRFAFKAYNTVSETHNHTYACFERELQANLATNGSPSLQYVPQPGLCSVQQNIRITSASPKSLMIFPPVEHESMLPKHIDRSKVFVPKSNE